MRGSLPATAGLTWICARLALVNVGYINSYRWLGRNTQAYYRILADVGKGSWHPENDALPWVRFCLIAHYQQAATLLKRNAVFGRVWEEIAKLASNLGLHERVQIALMDATLGYRVRSSRYRQENELSDVVASRDLKKLCDAGLLHPVGEKRGRYYTATAPLKAIMETCRDNAKAGDPYEFLRRGANDLGHPRLPGL